MTLPTTTSSTSKLIRQIERIEAIPKATKAEASEIADLLLARYAGQRANDPEIYYAMLVSAMAYLSVVTFRALGGQYGPHQHDSVTGAAIYWYVMVAIFAVIWIAVYITK